jgi:outer membrane biosynthesis protein TonB
MTDTNRSLSELPGLVAERRKFNGWLRALDARKETTPGHVFERVQSDYRTRLARVEEQIEAHRHVVDEERANVRSRLSLLEAEERMRRDERAELELRAHVGELEGDEATSAFKAVDDAIAALLGEKEGLQSRIDELEALLEERPTPAESREAEPPMPMVTPAPPAVPVAAAPAAQKPAPAPASAKPPTPAQQQTRSQTPADMSPSTKPQPAATDASFDELAFLNTVVGSNDASQSLIGQSRRDSSLVREDRGGQPLLSDLNGGKPSAETPPLAANVTGNNPITLKATVNEQTKTLKCNECGGMNYPTEWYCERCGAELAAL